MPIECPVLIPRLSDTQFEALDHKVMACCYASQNTLGRLCDERIYENDIAARLQAQGTDGVQTQVPITLTHEEFTKTYRLDLVVKGMIYELKTVSSLTRDHKAQAIHYAALTGADRVKLVNFGSTRVEGRLLRSPLWHVDRRQFIVDNTRWRPLSASCGALLNRIAAVLKDWGAFLEARLYEEALVHFSGGETQCLRRLPVSRDGVVLGTHKLACHARDLAFVVTTFSDGAEAYEQQLRCLLHSLPLIGLQWLNLNHSNLQAVTIVNDLKIGAKE